MPSPGSQQKGEEKRGVASNLQEGDGKMLKAGNSYEKGKAFVTLGLSVRIKT